MYAINPDELIVADFAAKFISLYFDSSEYHFLSPGSKMNGLKCMTYPLTTQAFIRQEFFPHNDKWRPLSKI
jgi:hypothetical protein